MVSKYVERFGRCCLYRMPRIQAIVLKGPRWPAYSSFEIGLHLWFYTNLPLNAIRLSSV